MAVSKTFHEGQTPISCQLCEESNEIKWKCMQCDFLMCTKCQKIHKKVKSTDQHIIIDIKDIASHQQQTKNELDFSNILCGIHSGQNCCIFCQTCDEVICPSCIAITHTKHKMIELVEGYKLTVKKIKTFSSELDTKLSIYKRRRSNLLSFKSSEELKFEGEKQKILSREKVLKAEVELHTKELLKKLHQRSDLQTKSIMHVANQSQKINKDLELRAMSLTKALDSVNTLDVFSSYKKEEAARKHSIEPVNSQFKRVPHYVPGQLSIKQEIHGELIESDHIYSLAPYEFKVMTKFKTGLDRVEMMFFCPDGTLWISDFSDSILQKLQFSNGLVEVVHSKRIYCGGMAILPSGDFLISTRESSLKILSKTTGKTTSLKYSVAPLITGHIHRTRDSKIIVRARTKGDVFPLKGSRPVVVMDMEGRNEMMYELNNNGKSLFSAPQKITTDTDNNIYVLDRLSEDKIGRIMALHKSNGVRWIYSGNSDINNGQTKFKSTDVISTKLNNLIITDMYNDMIYILNSSGECFHYLNTKDQLGFQRPYSLEVDNAGTLYIGCGANSGQSYEANIFTVHFSGF